MDSHGTATRRVPVIKPVEDRRIAGIGLGLCAFALFSVLDSLAKWLVLQDVPVLQAALFRYAVNLGLVVIILLPSHGLGIARSSNPALALARGLALLTCTLLNFLAVKYLPLTVTGALLFAMPLAVCALSVPLLGERVGWRRWVAVLVGLAGVLVIIRPGGAEFHWAVWLSVASVIANALYVIATRKLAGRDSPYTLQFYATALPTVCILPFAIAAWEWPEGPVIWTGLLMLGVLGGSAHLVLTMAHRLAPASTIAPFTYTQILYLTPISWLVFNEPPTVWVIIGAPLVIGSGLYIWMRERKLAIPTNPVPPAP